ncbi:MAG: uncharacterized protein HW403_1182 [Dehalococcoidia bacterium]|nr:uncharacterized protein [Dehalococcoidia bacterium]
MRLPTGFLSVALAALFMSATAWVGYDSYRAARGHLDAGLTHLASGMAILEQEGSLTGVNAEKLLRARDELARAREEFAELRDAARPWDALLPALKWAPGYGGELAAAPYLTQMAVAGAMTGELTLSAMAPVVEAAFQTEASSGSSTRMALVVEALASARPQIEEAVRALEKLTILRDKVKEDTLRQPRLIQALERMDKVFPPLKAALEAALVAPDLLGANSPAHYLLPLQNNTELRATGGFIGSAAIITVERGRITELDFRDSYDFYSSQPRPYIPPPTPYSRYMLFEDWSLRDANWWADFPTSAEWMQAFLQADTGQVVDGVIAIDQTVVQKLLEVLGPVDVPLFQERVDASNLFAVLDIYAHPPGYKAFDSFNDQRKLVLEDRKAFVGYLGETILQRLEGSSAESLMKLAPVVRDLLAQKHVLLYFNHPQAASLARAAGWDGAVKEHPNDFFMVVDTNMGYSKADAYVNRSISYTIQVGPDLAPRRSRLSITYRNSNRTEAPQCQANDIDFYTSADSCYKDYIRVYLPPESLYVSASGLDSPPEVYMEGDKLVLAGLMVLNPGEVRETSFEYVPPRSAINYRGGLEYRLEVQKQPGTYAVPLSVHLQLAENFRVAGVQSTGVPSDTATTIQTTLERDRQIQVKIARKE